jgi:hypothetical protein
MPLAPCAARRSTRHLTKPTLQNEQLSPLLLTKALPVFLAQLRGSLAAPPARALPSALEADSFIQLGRNEEAVIDALCDLHARAEAARVASQLACCCTDARAAADAATPPDARRVCGAQEASLAAVTAALYRGTTFFGAYLLYYAPVRRAVVALCAHDALPVFFDSDDEWDEEDEDASASESESRSSELASSSSEDAAPRSAAELVAAWAHFTHVVRYSLDAVGAEHARAHHAGLVELLGEEATESELDEMEKETEAEFECPWGWCGGDEEQHELLCMTSQCYFSCSWMHNRPREFIWSICEADPWMRDERGVPQALRQGAGASAGTAGVEVA